MLEKFLHNKKLRTKINTFFIEHKEQIMDIVLFGSIVRGKEKPSDIDVLLLFNSKENIEIAYSFRKALKSFSFSLNVITKTYATLLSESFPAKTSILAEGYSLIYNNRLASCFGYSSFILFRYSLKGFHQSKRMLFHYSLHGRYKNEGMLKKLGLLKFSDTIILSPINTAEETREYISSWKITFDEFPVLFPNRVSII